MINDYKIHKICFVLVMLFYGDNVCLGVCVVVFMRIDTLKKMLVWKGLSRYFFEYIGRMKFWGILLLLKITFKIKGGYGCIFRFVGMLF